MLNGDMEPLIHAREQLLEDAQVAAITPLLAGKVSAAQATKKMADDLTRIINRK